MQRLRLLGEASRLQGPAALASDAIGWPAGHPPRIFHASVNDKKKRASEEARLFLARPGSGSIAYQVAAAAAFSRIIRFLEKLTCLASTGRSIMMARKAAVRSIAATV